MRLPCREDLLCLKSSELYCIIGTPDRRDLSHPVHADNCVQEEHNGECHKKSPAYTWRDYRLDKSN